MADEKQMTITKAENYQESYADSVAMNCNLWDFVLTLGLVDYTDLPGTIANYHRLRLSPQTAKALQAMLTAQLDIYEKKFGPIPIPVDQPVVAPTMGIVN